MIKTYNMERIYTSKNKADEAGAGAGACAGFRIIIISLLGWSDAFGADRLICSVISAKSRSREAILSAISLSISSPIGESEPGPGPEPSYFADTDADADAAAAPL